MPSLDSLAFFLLFCFLLPPPRAESGPLDVLFRVLRHVNFVGQKSARTFTDFHHYAADHRYIMSQAASALKRFNGPFHKVPCEAQNAGLCELRPSL